MTFTLPDLDYNHDALEPYIDRQTMEIHHGKHHAGYVKKLNKAIEQEESLAQSQLTDILQQLRKLPDNIRTAVRNNGGGHYNHALFWKVIGPQHDAQPQGDLAEAIQNAFGSLDEMKAEYTKAATGRFGSGWTWLIVRDNKLDICSTPNQDNPIMDISDYRGVPVLGLDVWEHAYYLKYQNRRADYIDAFWHIVNWDNVAALYAKAMEMETANI